MRETGPKTMSKLPLPLTYVVEKVAPRPSGAVTAHRPEDVNRPCHRIAKKKEGKSTNRHVWCSVELRTRKNWFKMMSITGARETTHDYRELNL